MLKPHYQPKYTNHQPLLCWYKNVSNSIQIIRLRNPSPSPFEKVVFPNQRLLFNANLEQFLDIYICQEGTLQLWDSFRCEHLQVVETQPSLESKYEKLSSLTVQKS